jgi:hypothetical protein
MLAFGVGLGPVPVRREPRQPQTTQQPPQQQPQLQSPPATAPEKLPPPASGFDDRVIERVRRELQLAPGLAISGPKPKADAPVYRVQVFGYRFQLPDWRDRMPSAPAVPQPFGGADYYEMMRLITPPEFWGSAPMSNRDVLNLLVTAGETWAARKAVKKAINAYENVSKKRLHEEVQRELAELAAHNAAVDKKKQDEKKAVEVKKK